MFFFPPPKRGGGGHFGEGEQDLGEVEQNYATRQFTVSLITMLVWQTINIYAPAALLSHASLRPKLNLLCCQFTIC